MHDLNHAADSMRATASEFDNLAEHWRETKKRAEVREIWFMNRASALREAAGKVERIAEDYGKWGEES